jgi:putative transposase
VKKGKTRKLNSKTSRAMHAWSHYRFRMHLHNKAREFPWCQVIDTTEEFTSKTCGSCGNIDSTLGGKKDYKCLNCGFEADRDHNGARNILIRYMSKQS